MSEPIVLELSVSAKINFENVAKMNPGLKEHPYFIIAMDQLEEVIRKLEEIEGCKK